MARRRIFWHLGPDDVGTRFVATALDHQRQRLAEQDVVVAGTPAAWDLVTAELRREHRPLGYRRAEVEGQYDALVRRLWTHRGTSVLSTPGLAGAAPDQVALALDAIRGAELHLVLVVRDDESRAHAAVQAALEAGSATPTRPTPELLHGADHDVASILERWGRTVLPEHVHVVRECEPARVWSALTTLLGVDVAWPELPTTGQLDDERTALLRDVVTTLGDRIDATGRRTAVRDLLVGTLLGGRRDVTATSALADALLEITRLQRDNAVLREQNAHLDRKRRKHKRRLKELDRSAA